LGFSVKEIWSDPEGLVSVSLNSFIPPKGCWAGNDRAGEGRSTESGVLPMVLTCDGTDMSTNSTDWMGVADNRGGNGVEGRTIHHELNALELF